MRGGIQAYDPVGKSQYVHVEQKYPGNAASLLQLVV